MLLNNYNQCSFFKSQRWLAPVIPLTLFAAALIRQSRKNMRCGRPISQSLLKSIHYPFIFEKDGRHSKLEEETEQLEKELTRRSAGFRDNSRELGINVQIQWQTNWRMKRRLLSLSVSVLITSGGQTASCMRPIF